MHIDCKTCACIIKPNINETKINITKSARTPTNIGNRDVEHVDSFEYTGIDACENREEQT
jgi:hypothetical protein